MLRFRAPSSNAIQGDATDLFAVGQLIDDAMRPGNFFVAPGVHLTWISAQAQTVPWEIFRGRLVEPTREQRTFLSWHAEQDGNPGISVLLDVHTRQIHVVRGFLAYVWEGYDAGGAIESREITKWARERVGTIPLLDYADLDNLRDELICLLWQAFVGASRLPLHSVEAPLPAFTFGQIHYRYRANADDRPMASWNGLMATSGHTDLGSGESTKIVEFVLRHIESQELPKFVKSVHCKRHDREQTGLAIWQRMFNDVSLSPYTSFVDNALSAMDFMAERGVLSQEQRIDFLGHLLLKLGRHLTAFDLVTFHHRGANYPDALLLDAVLKRFLQAIEAHLHFFVGDDRASRRRRRALRQACLARRHYEGHFVPDLPTSPGENARVLPASHPRVPEAQLLQTIRRRRQLYHDDPICGLINNQARKALQMSMEDLMLGEERTELGLGVFIDRPLGYAKAVGEPDLTPLLAHEAFSPSLAGRRWKELKHFSNELGISSHESKLDEWFETATWPVGMPHRELAECPRPAAALSDVRKVADDFVILRTLPGGVAQLVGLFDWRGLLDRFRLQFMAQDDVRLCAQILDEHRHPAIGIYDGNLRRRLELVVDVQHGFRTRAGIEWPRSGLRIRTVWDDNGVKHNEVDVIVPGVQQAPDYQRPG